VNDGSQEGFLLARSQAQLRDFLFGEGWILEERRRGKSLCIYIPVSLLAVVFDIISSFITPQ